MDQMSRLIAISGKGGVGKTTIAGLLVIRLIARGCKPVLAIDADPNTCLDDALDVRVYKTIGGVREEARELSGKGMSGGISKQELLEMKIAESMVEANGFDLIAMGRPEGPGCYCYANNVLKTVIREISSAYPYVVLDNEAGMENLSRRIVQELDLLVMVTDPSRKGLDTVKRLHDLTGEMDIRYQRLAIIVNRLRNGHELPGSAIELKSVTGAGMVVGLPDDKQLAELAEKGESLWSIADPHPVSDSLDELLTMMDIT
jgi:CO dehydrogenase maturation factor